MSRCRGPTTARLGKPSVKSDRPSRATAHGLPGSLYYHIIFISPLFCLASLLCLEIKDYPCHAQPCCVSEHSSPHARYYNWHDELFRHPNSIFYALDVGLGLQRPESQRNSLTL
jgi:hypothetical protein